MSTNPNVLPNYKQINDAISTLGAPMEGDALLPQTHEGRIAHLLNIYEGVKPLLTVLATLPIFPKSWRAALSLFNGALQAVADGLAGMPAEFKTGMDL